MLGQTFLDRINRECYCIPCIFTEYSRVLRFTIHTYIYYVQPLKRKKVKRERKRNILTVESFASKSNIYRHSTWLILVGICCSTVISNGFYGYLNNHLAHPPSLNCLRPVTPFLFLSPFSFLGTLTLSETRVLAIEGRRLLSLAFHFLTVTDDQGDLPRLPLLSKNRFQESIIIVFEGTSDRDLDTDYYRFIRME